MRVNKIIITLERKFADDSWFTGKTNFTLVLIRLIGKKQPSRMNPFYFIDYAALG